MERKISPLTANSRCFGTLLSIITNFTLPTPPLLEHTPRIIISSHFNLTGLKHDPCREPEENTDAYNEADRYKTAAFFLFHSMNSFQFRDPYRHFEILQSFKRLFKTFVPDDLGNDFPCGRLVTAGYGEFEVGILFDHLDLRYRSPSERIEKPAVAIVRFSESEQIRSACRQRRDVPGRPRLRG